MKKHLALLAVPALMWGAFAMSQSTFAEQPSTEKKQTPMKPNNADVPPVLNFTMKSLAGKDVPLSKYSGKVVLMVNVASKCGLTPQYKGLQALHEKYAPQGLAILGFPSNDFGGQEPGSDEEIESFCRRNYGVEFDMFSKITVKGDGKHPLYKFLTSEETNPQHAGEIGWNFEKFLIDRQGRIVTRINFKVAPESTEVIKAIEAELAKK